MGNIIQNLLLLKMQFYGYKLAAAGEAIGDECITHH